jgi:hypothetical protein
LTTKVPKQLLKFSASFDLCSDVLICAQNGTNNQEFKEIQVVQITLEDDHNAISGSISDLAEKSSWQEAL